MSQRWKRHYFTGRIARAGFRIASLPRTIARWDAVRRRPSTEKQLGSPVLFRYNRHGAAHSSDWIVADRPGAARRAVIDRSRISSVVRLPLKHTSRSRLHIVTQRRRRKPSSPREVELRGGGNQRPRVLMLRGREKLGSRCWLDDSTFQHDVVTLRYRPD